MNTLEATFRIVTPMFLGGAAPEISAELRAPSIRGVLRFWWRALNYSSLNGNISQLAKQESETFGSTEGSGCFQIRIWMKEKFEMTLQGTQLKAVVNPDRPGARYLGFGLMDAFDGKNTKAGKLLRSCICQGQDFSLIAVSRIYFPDSLVDSLKLFGLIGGLGSRSRKGFGSITLNTIKINEQEIWKKPETVDDYKKTLKLLLQETTSHDSDPEISAFSDRSRIIFIDVDGDPLSLLDYWGRRLQRYRSWGFKGSVNGLPSEKNFEDDHNWFKYIGDYRDSDFHPRRVIFGLPHNYDSKRVDGVVNGTIHDRRASPLFFHIHEFSEDKYGAVAFLLPSIFLPIDEKINAGGKSVKQNIQWDVLTKFLDNNDYFPKSIQWL